MKPLPVLVDDDDRRRARELVLLGEIQRLHGRYGSARMALAATFDPLEIAGTTVSPDKEAARAWYKRSRELMDAAIAYYLKRLER